MYALLALCTSALVILAFVIGTKMGQGRSDRRLTYPEKKDLTRLRNFEADVLNMAHEHLAYGDTLAPKIIDRGRRELE